MVGRAPIAVHSSKENLTQESEQVPSFLVDVVETSPSAHKIYLVWLAVLDKHTCRIPDPIWLRNLHKGSWCSMMFLLIFDNLTGDILSGWQVTKMAHVTWFQVESSAALYHLRNFSESFWENQWAKSSIHTFSRLSLFFPEHFLVSPRLWWRTMACPTRLDCWILVKMMPVPNFTSPTAPWRNHRGVDPDVPCGTLW